MYTQTASDKEVEQAASGKELESKDEHDEETTVPKLSVSSERSQRRN